MRRASRRLAPLVVSLLAFGLPPDPVTAAPSEADSAFKAWRIPEHRWWSSSASVAGGGSHANISQSNGSHNRFGSLRGILGAGATWGFDSDPTALAWSLSADVSGFRSHEEFGVLDAFQDFASERSTEELRERFFASASWRRYPWALPVGFSLGTAHNYQLFQRFTSENGSNETGNQLQTIVNSSAQGAWEYQGVLSAGIGLGRVRDATPVYQAQVLEDRLRSTGALSRALSPEARRRLTDLVATQGAVVYAHQRPDKYFWEALEGVLRDDGALERGSLDAYSAHRVLEPLTPAVILFRRIGYFVGPSVTLSTHRAHLSLEQSYSSLFYLNGSLVNSLEFRDETEQSDRNDQIFTGLVAEAHRPLGLRWQLDAAHLTQVGESGATLATTTLLSGTYLVADRWAGGVSARHTAFASGQGSARRIDQWDVFVAADLRYFVEDSWALTLRLSENQRHTSDHFYRFGDFSLGITRVLGGYFDLSGITTMRAAPPTR